MPTLRRAFFLLISFFCINITCSNSYQQIIANLLEEAYPYTSECEIITQNEQNELNFDGMLSALNRAQTLFGIWGLRQLSCPTFKRSDIEAAQKRLRLLLSDSDLFDTITHLLSEIKEGQQSLFVYYNEHSRLRSDVQSLYYYYIPGSRRLNKNKLALDVSYLLSYTALVGNKVLLLGLMDQMTKIATTGNFSSFGFSLSTLIGNPVRSNTPWKVQLKDQMVYEQCLNDPKLRQEIYSQGSFADRVLLIYSGSAESYPHDWWRRKGLAGCGVGALTMNQICYNVGYAVTAQSAYDRVKFLWRIMTQLKQTTVQLARVMRAVNELAIYLEQHPELARWEPLKPLMSLLSDSGYWSANVQSLFDRLYLSTFDLNTNDYWYSRGQVLLAHKKMKEIRYDLIPLWSSIAHIDAQVGIARLYKEHQDTQNPFCFAGLSPQKTPLLLLEDFWFPLTYGGTIVNNSIEMGNNEKASKIILTGPNGGGKSTVMKSVCWSAIFAQSWGIVPARSATMSLFTSLKTSLNPVENIEEGLSTFMAEKAAMTKIETFINGSGQEACVLLALDEPYRGTVEVEAADRVCDFCHELSADNRVALLIATHLEAPTLLERTSSFFSNYQMEFAEKDSGEVVRTFKLMPGAAQWWFHDPIKRKKIIESLGV